MIKKRFLFILWIAFAVISISKANAQPSPNFLEQIIPIFTASADAIRGEYLEAQGNRIFYKSKLTVDGFFLKFFEENGVNYVLFERDLYANNAFGSSSSTGNIMDDEQYFLYIRNELRKLKANKYKKQYFSVVDHEDDPLARSNGIYEYSRVTYRSVRTLLVYINKNKKLMFAMQWKG